MRAYYQESGVKHELVKVDVAPFMGERGSQTVFQIRYLKRIRNPHNGPFSRREFRDALDVAFLPRKIGVSVKVGLLLDQDGEVIGLDGELDPAVFLLQ
jgi:hypothetical protein